MMGCEGHRFATPDEALFTAEVLGDRVTKYFYDSKRKHKKKPRTTTHKPEVAQGCIPLENLPKPPKKSKSLRRKVGVWVAELLLPLNITGSNEITRIEEHVRHLARKWSTFRGEGPIEGASREFIDQYLSQFPSLYARHMEAVEAHQAHRLSYYDTNWTPHFLWQPWLFDNPASGSAAAIVTEPPPMPSPGTEQVDMFWTPEKRVRKLSGKSKLDYSDPVSRLKLYRANGLIGGFVEVEMARILNAFITDMDGKLPDLVINTPEGPIYVECKAARISNEEKYTSPSGANLPVSGRWFFIKGNQTRSGVNMEMVNPGTITYAALVDYDFRDYGRCMTTQRYVQLNPEVFNVFPQDEAELSQIYERLQQHIVLHNITLVPMWALYEWWNYNVMGSVPTHPAHKGISSLTPMAQHLRRSHMQYLRERLTEYGIPRHAHILEGAWVEPSVKLESFGYRFLPDAVMKYPSL